MASLEWEGLTDRPPDPVGPTEPADPYEGAVDRLLALVEENQVAITALAQAWRHTNRTLHLTQAQLAHTQQMLADERRRASA